MAAIARSPFAHRISERRNVLGAQASVLIHDLTPIGRTGFKGAGTSDWTASQVSAIPDRPNRAVTLADGTVVARLGKEEYLVLDSRKSPGSVSAELEATWAKGSTESSARMGYPLPRADSHSWLFLEGTRVPEMMAKICGVDLRLANFPEGEIAQTIVARIGAVIIREIGAPSKGLHLLTDFASADYLWEVLEDASAEYGGGFAPDGRT
ncbi:MULTISPECIES: sarcosine oxidase subunit gamma family protein [unclassified Rhizobium]|uniref:sarcosine oxidase subunit gamma family protein n=1 Tax=unclassified Rhizobium TaxID=2613769 RepID=UPI000EAA7966|nr:MULTISPECIES: sarcosine oxidase subunit gamma family protein [unclassified Rhizobium]AYG70866.1 sarcosine oxidase [Rhizobium sp. CCGE531]AYG77181.1 sarcosine oxidase [Rhizobium sp. CCGE532]